MTDVLFDELTRTVGFLRARLDGRVPTVGLILGSGLGGFADDLASSIAIPYAEIPHFPRSTVNGHAGRLVIGTRAGLTCAAMQGRVHYYEGHAAHLVAYPVRSLIALGCSTIIVTNAAGGLKHPPGTLMLIRDHINLIPDSPLRGLNDERLGPRFPDMTRAYDPALRLLAHEAARSIGVSLGDGVYAALPGPAYETPAEIGMLAAIGADAAGMSTAPETVAAVHMGARVLGISCITNHAAGLGLGAPLSHAEVTETADRVRGEFVALLDAILGRLAAEPERAPARSSLP
jgi:purine-nucleoside phosphorylase